MLVVKHQFLVQGLGVDFVFALSQEQEQQEPHQNIQEGSIYLSLFTMSNHIMIF